MMKRTMPAVTLKQAKAAKQTAAARLRAVTEIVGIGITRVAGEYAVKINLREAVTPKTKVPDEIDGVQVCVEITGEITSRPR